MIMTTIRAREIAEETRKQLEIDRVTERRVCGMAGVAAIILFVLCAIFGIGN